jgi:hypothetical protein
MSSRDLLKRGYYAFDRRRHLHGYQLHLGYVFHTERIHDERVFARLMAFCRDYKAMTGAQPIALLMSGVNPRVRAEMKEHGVSAATYASRAHQLATVATLGYHGHFWLSQEGFTHPWNEVRCNNFLQEPVADQMAADLGWFKENSLDTNGLYAGGWWFLNDAVLALLAKAGFRVDLSHSKSPWFRNQASHAFMVQHDIRTGEPFRRIVAGHDMLFIQNLIGCHTTRFVRDFDRVMARLAPPDYRKWTGVVNSHDDDLVPDRTLDCIRHLRATYGTRFLAAESLVKYAAAQARRIDELEPLHGP